ncbi:MAG: hypothetical protein Q4G13_05780 [Moraxella sp.]|nr:hypothetical protein [Moraxella sp.]
MLLGSTAAKDIITPADLTDQQDTTTRILQILQTLDNDPSNGITISEDVAKRFVEADNKALIEESDDSEFTKNIAPKLNTNQKVVSRDDAQKHFDDTLKAQPAFIAAAKKFEGYWEGNCIWNDYGGGRGYAQRTISQLTVDPANPLLVTDTSKYMTRTYDNPNCTGTHTSENKSDYLGSTSLKILGINADGTVRILRTSVYGSDIQSDTTNIKWDSATRYTNRARAFAKRTSFTDWSATPVQPPIATGEVEKAVNTLVGYWQGSCNYKSGQAGSWRTYFQLAKSSATEFREVDYREVQYENNRDCSGKILANHKVQNKSHVLSNPSPTSGLWIFTATNYDNKKLMVISSNVFEADNKAFTRMTKAQYNAIK